MLSNITLAPDSVTWGGGAVVLETITTNKRYLVLTPTTGAVTADVGYIGDRTWYWATERSGRVVYSNARQHPKCNELQPPAS